MKLRLPNPRTVITHCSSCSPARPAPARTPCSTNWPPAAIAFIAFAMKAIAAGGQFVEHGVLAGAGRAGEHDEQCVITVLGFGSRSFIHAHSVSIRRSSQKRG